MNIDFTSCHAFLLVRYLYYFNGINKVFSRLYFSLDSSVKGFSSKLGTHRIQPWVAFFRFEKRNLKLSTTDSATLWVVYLLMLDTFQDILSWMQPFLISASIFILDTLTNCFQINTAGSLCRLNIWSQFITEYIVGKSFLFNSLKEK